MSVFLSIPVSTVTSAERRFFGEIFLQINCTVLPFITFYCNKCYFGLWRSLSCFENFCYKHVFGKLYCRIVIKFDRVIYKANRNVQNSLI